MVVVWYKKSMVILLGIISGILVSLAFIRPYQDEIPLAELVLQLSGARGTFALGCSLTELVRFMLCMVPNVLIVMVLGNQLYRHFCTASIYVFSRCPNRLAWYRNSLVPLFAHVLLFKVVFVAGAVLAAMPRCRIMVSRGGVLLLGAHVLIYLLWIFGWVLLTNLLAIGLGSSRAFLIVMTVQALCTASLAIIGVLEKKQMSQNVIERLLWFNPVAHTVFSWHQGAPFTKELAESRYALNLGFSAVLLLLFDTAIVVLGGIFVKNRDLLSENRETEEG
ncbi:MAG: hypothetical protein HDR21_00670 [Lachnospiraceae bacterium]|nr:hypothetical protein [Lachnospiraceae bacterium]MBD5483762.1 hypothetical protein [Lachnospiraceae bacterium]